mgnify:CR=1 FL=1
MYSDNLTQKVAQAAAKIMDEELKGKQHKIDANKNGKVDAHDFKLLRAKKEVKEESEQIDELSKATLRSYLKGNRDENQGSLGSAGHMSDKARSLGRTNDDKDDARYEGGKLARRKLGAPGLVPAKVMAQNQAKKLTKEEQEFIDELNKSTLGSYVKKAHRSGTDNSFDHGEDEHRQDGDSDDTEREKEMQDRERAIANREKGIGRAVKKLTKEEQEFIDELAEGTYKHEVEKSFPASGVKTGDSASKGTSTMPKDKDKAKGQPAGSIGEGYYKDIDTNRKEDERLAKKDSSPFGKPDKKKTKIATPGKFGYGYSAARHLARQGMASVTKEETEQVDEVIQKTSSGYIHHARPGVYGGSEKEKHVVDTLRGPKKSELNAIEKEKKMKKTFSEMVELYNEIGLKSLSNMISEEPDNEQFTQELKDQEAKAAGKGKKAEVAKGAVQAVKVEEDVEQIDELSKDTLGNYVKRANNQAIIKSLANPKNDSDDMKTIVKREKGINLATSKLTREEIDQVEERSLTEPEMKKKEEIVKSMKKGLSGFKDRYGDRAKEVMYATATKQAKGD